MGRQAQYYHDLYLLLTQVGGVTLTELAGDIYKEDLAYLLAQQRFRSEAQHKWNNSDNYGSARMGR